MRLGAGCAATSIIKSEPATSPLCRTSSPAVGSIRPTMNEMGAAIRKRIDGPVVVWTVNGSSVHKVWPYAHTVSKWLLEKTPAHIIFYGDPGPGKKLAEAIMDCLKEDGSDMTRVRSIADKWSIRQSLTFAQIADVVVGQRDRAVECGRDGRTGNEGDPAVAFQCGEPDQALGQHANAGDRSGESSCSPCHRLHHGLDVLPQAREIGTGVVCANIKPETVFKAIAKALGATVTPPTKKADGLIPPA